MTRHQCRQCSRPTATERGGMCGPCSARCLAWDLASLAVQGLGWAIVVAAAAAALR